LHSGVRDRRCCHSLSCVITNRRASGDKVVKHHARLLSVPVARGLARLGVRRRAVEDFAGPRGLKGAFLRKVFVPAGLVPPVPTRLLGAAMRPSSVSRPIRPAYSRSGRRARPQSPKVARPGAHLSRTLPCGHTHIHIWI